MTVPLDLLPNSGLGVRAFDGVTRGHGSCETSSGKD